jgi:hypothetical protein
MKRYTHLVTLLLFLALLALAVTQTGTAGNDVTTSLLNSFDLSWWTVDGGGATAVTGGAYSLGGTVGQADTAVLSGGNYNLAGGFWSGAGETTYKIYLPMTVR